MDGLSRICAGLGILDEDDNGNRIGYVKGEYCSDDLKDLLRFLRRDDPEKRDVFKQVCKWNILGKDLIPIIEYCQEDRNLVLNAVKVLVFLTMPIEQMSFDIPQQIEYLWGLKSAITFSDIVPVIVSLLETPLENLENESFREDDWKLLQLVLTLFKNILAIQDISIQQKAGGSAAQFLFLRDRFLELLFKENVMDLILVLSQHIGGSNGYLRQDNMLLLEIYYYILKGQEPELIAKASIKGSKVEDAAEDSVTLLQSIMQDEREKRKLTRSHNLSCHSQFSGTFTRLTLDGSKTIFKGNPSASADALLKSHKNFRGPSKKGVWDHEELPSSKPQIVHLLADFVSQFLLGGYNVLMQSIREDIDKEHQEIQSSDIVTFFQVAQFVTSFQYHKCLTVKPSIDADNEAPASFHDDSTLFRGSICGPIAETLNESMFQIIISKWRYAFEGLKQTNDYKFLSAAGSLVKIMIRMLDLVLRQSAEDSKEPQTARILLYKLFYDQTEEGMTCFLLNLIRSFDAHKQPKSDLANLVESMHVILRLLEDLQSHGTLRVSEKSRKKKTKKRVKESGAVCEPTVDNVGSSTSGEPVEANMLDKEATTQKEVEMEADKSIRISVPIDGPAPNPSNPGNTESEVDGRNVADNDGAGLETDDSSGDKQQVLTTEVDFKASSVVSALANNSIVQKLCWLLKFYKSNSISTNHYIVTMLRRICDDLELPPMLYQLSYLTIFYDILEEQKSRPCKQHENIVIFVTSLVRRMLRKMKSYPLLFVEVLFWKTRRECQLINCGSMLSELKNIRSDIGEGRGNAENGVNGYFEGQQWVLRSLADALGDDDFDAPFEDNNLGVHSEEEPNWSSEVGNYLALGDEMEGRLKYLYEKYKDDPNCGRLIAEELDPNMAISELQVSNKLVELGLKLPPKAKMQRSNAPHRPKDNKQDLSGSTSNPTLTAAKENSSLRKPMHSRKRVQAFSSDQEQKIKELFEQFKDCKKCSHMIANALDGTGQISAARVSRKLKQLGLVPKKTIANMNMRDEVLSDKPSEGAGESDDEMLLSLRNRSKQKRKESHFSEKPSNKIARELPEDISDDELLSSMRVKTKKVPTKGEDAECVTDSLVKSSVETNSVTQNILASERDECMVSNQLAGDKTEGGPADDAVMETSATDDLNASGARSLDEADKIQDPLFDDEVVDDFDELELVAMQVTRRRLRMVIDFEDDDE